MVRKNACEVRDLGLIPRSGVNVLLTIWYQACTQDPQFAIVRARFQASIVSPCTGTFRLKHHRHGVHSLGNRGVAGAWCIDSMYFCRLHFCRAGEDDQSAAPASLTQAKTLRGNPLRFDWLVWNLRSHWKGVCWQLNIHVVYILYYYFVIDINE